jgi:excinuclease UvrABC nuclease subunit
MSQLLLLPDPRPLDQQFGRKFFLMAPRRTGVYLMRDAADKILYIGKAKDLKQRLGNYRSANPDRLPRRHLRLVRQVARIEFQFCKNENEALDQEKKLIFRHKPRFNRAGVRQGKSKFIVWRIEGERLEIAVVETPGQGWRRFGPLGANAHSLCRSIARLLWLVVNPDRNPSELPIGWTRSTGGVNFSLLTGGLHKEIITQLDGCFWDSPDRLISWLTEKFANRQTAFERRAILQEFEMVKTLSTKRHDRPNQYSLI